MQRKVCVDIGVNEEELSLVVSDFVEMIRTGWIYLHVHLTVALILTELYSAV